MMKLAIFLAFAVASALARFEYKAVINDPLIEIELLRCRFETKEFTYRLTNNQLNTNNLHVYGSGRTLTNTKMLNYAYHTIAPGSAVFNVVKTIDGEEIDPKYAVISVEDATGNLLVRKSFDCDTINPKFVDKPAYLTKVTYGDKKVIVDIRNFWTGEPKNAWIDFRQKTECDAEWCSNIPYTRFAKVELKLKDPEHRVELNVDFLNYCNETVELLFSTFHWHPYWGNPKYTESIYVNLPCPDLAGALSGFPTLKSLRKEMLNSDDATCVTCSNNICTVNKTELLTIHTSTKNEFIFKDLSVLPTKSLCESDAEKFLEFVSLSCVILIVITFWVVLYIVSKPYDKRHLECVDGCLRVAGVANGCKGNVKTEKRK